jgi:capsular polysaccharide biosynthesis protein
MRKLKRIYSEYIEQIIIGTIIDVMIRRIYYLFLDVHDFLKINFFFNSVNFENDLLINNEDIIQFSQPEMLNIQTPPKEFKVSHFRLGSNIWHGNVSLSQPHIFEIDNANYDSKTKFWHDEQNRIIDNVPGRSENIHLLYQDRPYEFTCQENLLEFDVAFALLPSSNYWGWLHNRLTQLQALDKYISVNGFVPKILIHKGAPNFVKQSLEIMGYGEHIVECDPASNIRVRKLVITSSRFPRNKFQSNYVKQKLVSPLTAQWLRKKFSQKLNLDDDNVENKIIVSRADVGTRRVANFDEIEQFAASNGFETYELANLDFAEQVRLFYSASQILGIHGAGLTNIIFSKDSHVIEILNAEKKPSFFYLSQCLPVTYECVSGKIVDSNIHSKNKDILVNVDDFDF